MNRLITHPLFVGLLACLFVANLLTFVIVFFRHPDLSSTTGGGGGGVKDAAALAHRSPARLLEDNNNKPQGGGGGGGPPHLFPKFPVLPIFAPIENGEELAKETLKGNGATMAGVIHVLQTFVTALHKDNIQRSQQKAEIPTLIKDYFDLVQKYLSPLEEAYQGKSIFEVRDDQSIYISLAAFREHLLTQTLQSAFDQAKHPEKLFVGVIVQNCYGQDDLGRPCRTGYQVIGKNAQGRDQVKMSDAPPDENGIQTFCNLPAYSKYCESGQIRVLYLWDTDALGPAAARYYASKLWGGETFMMQMDAHLEFAPHWDARYIDEVRAARNYPKAILSSYPPGFSSFGQYTGGTPGARLCRCEFSTNAVEAHIIRINTAGATPKDAPKPTQIAFIAAGFFFAHASFLKDVPFDPYVPWCFMGEEIALSMRAWTAGWDIYAPRENLIAHQYRPGRLGLPKFWESVGRDSGRPNLSNNLQKHVIRRIKNLVGYLDETKQAIEADGDGVVLRDLERYGLGKERTREAYLEFTNIDVANLQCKAMPWCVKGTKL